MHFAHSSASTWIGVLSIWNWTGTPILGGGAEQILFGGDVTGPSLTQLGQVSFYSDNGQTLLSNMAAILGDGEIVPSFIPVPEPATYVAAVLVLATLGQHARRSYKSLRAVAPAS